MVPRHFLRRALLVLAFAGLAGPLRAAIVVTYPVPSAQDQVWQFARPERYRVALLQAALERAGKGYVLRPAAQKMAQSRVIQELRRDSVDVMWTMTTRERERTMLPVRIPLTKGLIGVRLLLVNRADLDRFAHIATLAELRQLVAIQGHDWPDVAILRAQGLPVTTGANYTTLFSMLASHRGDYFPRGVTEIWNEAEATAHLGLVVEPTLALRYPAALYFFVTPGKRELAEDLRRGLEAMVADGSFDRLFHEYHDDYLKQANLKGRRIFDLPNPLLPEETPLQRKELWYAW